MNFTVEHGCFQYKNGPEILRDVSFTIGQRQILSVLGPNGVGKTTLIKCMLGLLPWNSGMSTLDGAPCAGGESRKIWRKVGYVPQRKQAGFAYTVCQQHRQQNYGQHDSAYLHSLFPPLYLPFLIPIVAHFFISCKDTTQSPSAPSLVSSSSIFFQISFCDARIS